MKGPQLRAGQRVKCRIPVGHNLMIDQIGIVVISGGVVGVMFGENVDGHDLGGHINNRHGWYVNEIYCDLIDDRTGNLLLTFDQLTEK